MSLSQLLAYRHLWSRLLLVLRGSVVFLAIIVGVTRTAIEVLEWDAPSNLVPWLAGVTIAGAALDASVSLVRSGNAARKNEAIGDIDRAINAAILTVARSTGADVASIGCGVWVVHRPWWAFGKPPALMRIRRFRLENYPPESNRVWTKGKGAIGRCWEKGDWQSHNWSEVKGKFAGKEVISRSSWKELSSAARWGFEQAEYLEVVRKYEWVLAAPVVSDAGKFLGCVSMDIPSPDVPRDPPLRIDSTARETLAQTARTVRNHMHARLL